tara:strand:- start:4498 stop:4785 length:288 start_codon:yes stop_codon:yes gene_type:complete
MSKPYHPCVDTNFIVQKITESNKIEEDSQLRAGNSYSFVMKGDKPFHKKHVTLREIDGCINFEQAMAKAILFGFIGDLLKWLEENKGWKEGEYLN